MSTRDDWSVGADILERELEAERELLRTLPPIDVEAAAEAIRGDDGGFAFFADWTRRHAEALQAGRPRLVIELPPLPAECPRCGGALISEVSDPSSARCTSCAEPLRRIT